MSDIDCLFELLDDYSEERLWRFLEVIGWIPGRGARLLLSHSSRESQRELLELMRSNKTEHPNLIERLAELERELGGSTKAKAQLATEHGCSVRTIERRVKALSLTVTDTQ